MVRAIVRVRVRVMVRVRLGDAVVRNAVGRKVGNRFSHLASYASPKYFPLKIWRKNIRVCWVMGKKQNYWGD